MGKKLREGVNGDRPAKASLVSRCRGWVVSLHPQKKSHQKVLSPGRFRDLIWREGLSRGSSKKNEVIAVGPDAKGARVPSPRAGLEPEADAHRGQTKRKSGEDGGCEPVGSLGPAFPPSPRKKPSPASTPSLESSLQDPETVEVPCLSHSVCALWLWQL